jgi:hypothetical protein
MKNKQFNPREKLKQMFFWGHQIPSHSFRLPHWVWALAGVYCVASLVHFAHNAEYIAFYPNMPAGLTRETVYLVWLAITGVGLASVFLRVLGWLRTSVFVLAVYGAFGLDAFGHYALALCSQHTLAMNTTIWFEGLAGLSLAATALFFGGKSLRGVA